MRFHGTAELGARSKGTAESGEGKFFALGFDPDAAHTALTVESDDLWYRDGDESPMLLNSIQLLPFIALRISSWAKTVSARCILLRRHIVNSNGARRVTSLTRGTTTTTLLLRTRAGCVESMVCF